MRGTELGSRAAENARARHGCDSGGEQLLYGWGRIAPSRALVRRPSDVTDITGALAAVAPPSDGQAARGVIARGAGRSYGDAAQNRGGQVLDMTGLAKIVAIGRDGSTVTVQAGISLAALMSRLAGEELTLPVLPGTRHVTVGGAIASDIHGKSHHCDGSFSGHVRSILLCAPGGELLEISPDSERELFEATLGGMGLTGVIVQATLAVEPLRSPWVIADMDRTDDLDQTLELLSSRETSRWSVAWLDLLGRGGRMGRGVISRADPWPASADSASTDGEERERRTLALPERPRVTIRGSIPSGMLRPELVRAFNAARWRRAARRERGRRLGLAEYLFPLDGIGSWSRLYGRQGLVQYQFVVPAGREDALVRCVEMLRTRRAPVYLAVLKRFGAFPAGPLSFPMEGFTLALDLPGGAPGLRGALDELDEVVAGCGGRVYLTKDVRLRKDVLPAMYPLLDDFRSVRARVDPDGILRSDLARRLEL